MQILVIAEHDGRSLRSASVSCMTFAHAVAKSTGGTAAWLVLGKNVGAVAEEAAHFAPVFCIESPALEHPLAEPFAQAISSVMKKKEIEFVCAASSTFSKDILPRAIALLGGVMASEVVRHEFVDGRLLLDCPRYAGSVIATVVLHGSPQAVTVRSSEYPPLVAGEAKQSIEWIELDAADFVAQATYIDLQTKSSARPDVTEARVVVSGGRAFKNSDDFEQHVGRLADLLGGAAGSSRALVDAGITPNELQVGQTGKIVAPEIYIALGISGAVQHLAGMKNSRIIVAINNDRDAPIFDVADYGMVGDVYEIVPNLIDRLEKHAANR